MRISSLYLVRHPDARAILSQKRRGEFVSYQSFAKRDAEVGDIRCGICFHMPLIKAL